jgi:hypothetical protein
MAISHIENLKKYPNHKKRPLTLNLGTENLCPKTLLILAAGAKEEDDEQEDMVYTTGSLRVP